MPTLTVDGQTAFCEALFSLDHKHSQQAQPKPLQLESRNNLVGSSHNSFRITKTASTMASLQFNAFGE
jgi:hypothetical protein